MSGALELPHVLQSRFELTRELGAGGFGRVYLANDRLHGERVALKVLAKRDPHALKRFKTEFRSLANLVHHNLVSLFELHQTDEDHGLDSASWFFTMEHVDGRPFTDFLRPDTGSARAFPSLTLSHRAAAMRRLGSSRSNDASQSLESRLAPPALEETEDPRELGAHGPALLARALEQTRSGEAAAPPADAPWPRPAGRGAAADLTPEEHVPPAASSSSSATPPVPGTALSPQPFFGVEPPDAETAARWSALRPEPGSGDEFFGDGAEAGARLARLEDCFHQLVEALAWLHESGHLHRDVKPSNVLIDGDGRVKILDFGLVAKLHDLQETQDGRGDLLVGTPAFMAPELCAGMPASPASDWYSVGVMLYLVLTGRLPFTGDPQTVVLAKQALPPRRPSELTAVPEALDALCMALLAINPLERPDAAALRRAFGGGEDRDPLTRPTPRAATDVFVGRGAEVALLAAALAPSSPRPDAARVALVTGPSGHGKSALVRHVLRELGRATDPPHIILRSRCFERGTVRYRALDGAVDDLAGVLAAMPAAERQALIPRGLDRVALARLFPVLTLGEPAQPGAEPGRTADPTAADRAGANTDPTDLRRRALLALRELFVAISRERHLIFAIDDAQWADEDSVPLVADLIRHTRARWVFTFRHEEVARGAEASQSGTGSHLIRALTRDILPGLEASAVTRIDLGRLPPAEALALARESLEDWQVVVDEAQARRLAEEADGHPLLIAELARASVLAHGGEPVRAEPPGSTPQAQESAAPHPGGGLEVAPGGGASPGLGARSAEPGRVGPSLDALLASRVTGLPVRCRAAMELVALAGEPLPPRVLRLAAGADTADLQRLERDHLIATLPSADGELAICWHDRVRESTLSLITDDERCRLHLALARSGERVGLDDPFFLGTHYRRAIEGWLAGGRVVDTDLEATFARALEWGSRAIDRARISLAFDQAARVAESLIGLVERARRPGSPLGEPQVERALAGCGGLLRLALSLAESLANAGRGVLSAQAFERVAALSGSEVERQRFELRAAEQYLFAGAFGEGEATIRRVLGRAGLKVAQGVPGAMASFLWETLRMRVRGMRFEAVDESRLPSAELALVDTLWSATIGLSMAWPLGSQAFQQRHLRTALDAGEPRRVARALSIELAFSALPGGKAAARSAKLSELAHEVASRDPHPYPEAFVTMSDGGVHWLNGRWRAAKDAVERALIVYRRDCVGVTWEKDTAEFVALSALAHMGELDTLARRVDEVLADAVERGDLYLETQLRTRFLPLCDLRLGRPEAARAGVERALARWRGAGFQIVHYWGLVNRVNAWLYEGEAERAAAEIEASEKLVRRSFLLMGQYYRVHWHELLAKVAMALAERARQAASTPAVRASRKKAERSTKALRKEGMAWSEPLALLAEAELARFDGTSSAAELHQRAAKGFAEVEMKLHALAARSRDAELRGDAASLAAVHAELRALGVVDPQAMLAVFTARSL